MNENYTPEDAKLDEAMLEHYDDTYDFINYHKVLDRMRRNGYTPTGPGAPTK